MTNDEYLRLYYRRELAHEAKMNIADDLEYGDTPRQIDLTAAADDLTPEEAVEFLAEQIARLATGSHITKAELIRETAEDRQEIRYR